MAADAPRNVARPVRPLHWNTLVLQERARAGRPSGVPPTTTDQRAAYRYCDLLERAIGCDAVPWQTAGKNRT